MTVYISRVHIENFRNFHELDVSLAEKAVIVGENGAGKTNFIHALRLILDPDLPDSARRLKEDDFWDGLEAPMQNGTEITISIDLQGFESNESLLAILSDYIVDVGEHPSARITYKYMPLPDLGAGNGNSEEPKYDFVIYGGSDPTNIFGYQQRKWMPLQMLPALRDAEADLESWRRSPLRPLVDRLKVAREDLEEAAGKIQDATNALVDTEEIRLLSTDIEKRLEDMVGQFHSVSPSLGIASTDALRLLRSLRIFVDGERQRAIGDTSLGICNVLYLTLLVLELERKEAAGERACTILAIEEPEAHLHPHLQRLVYHDFLRRESCLLLTTHSPHIVSVSPLRSVVLLRDYGITTGSKATSTVKAVFNDAEVQDLERYLDATRAEMLFARGVILVEGDAERYVVPAVSGFPLDQRGISICSVQGTDFAPYCKLLGQQSLGIPFVVITDGDPYSVEGTQIYRGVQRATGLLRLQNPEVASQLDALSEHWVAVRKRLGEFGIYLSDHELEIDLANSGNGKRMLTTLEELGSGPKRRSKFETALSKAPDLSEKEIMEIMRIIEIYGKGRFAQRLASKLDEATAPKYIKQAIRHLVKAMDGGGK